MQQQEHMARHPSSEGLGWKTNVVVDSLASLPEEAKPFLMARVHERAGHHLVGMHVAWKD